jgi:hypothetical protein
MEDNMPIKQIIRPDRLREVPRQFNWIDHRLVRDRHIRKCGHADLTLYLFLVTVSDYQGLSYYSDRSIQKVLTMDQETLETARNKLIQADLIAFAHPLYQVLSLEAPRHTAPQPPPVQRTETIRGNHGPEAIGLILRRLRGEES